MLNKDFLQLHNEDIKYPQGRNPNLDMIFLSPPWGGVGYNQLQEYKIEYLYPNFKDVIKKALEFSRNLVFFLPKNTSVDEIIDNLIPFISQLSEDPSSRDHELVIEIE